MVTSMHCSTVWAVERVTELMVCWFLCRLLLQQVTFTNPRLRHAGMIIASLACMHPLKGGPPYHLQLGLHSPVCCCSSGLEST